MDVFRNMFRQSIGWCCLLEVLPSDDDESFRVVDGNVGTEASHGLSLCFKAVSSVYALSLGSFLRNRCVYQAGSGQPMLSRNLHSVRFPSSKS